MSKPQAEVNIMIDIETLGTDVNTAPILSIGACVFHSQGIGDIFYSEIDVKDQLIFGDSLEIDIDTLKWWAQQNTPMPIHGTEFISVVLGRLKDWIEGFGVTPIIWSKGPDFDIAILKRAFHHSGCSIPWKYNSVRDYRTVSKLFPVVPANPNVVHNALNDAITQALHLVDIFNYVGLWYNPEELNTRLEREKNGLDNSENVSGRNDQTESGTSDGATS